MKELESQSQAISEQMLETNDAKKTHGYRLNWTKSATSQEEEAMLEWEELSRAGVKDGTSWKSISRISNKWKLFFKEAAGESCSTSQLSL